MDLILFKTHLYKNLYYVTVHLYLTGTTISTGVVPPEQLLTGSGLIFPFLSGAGYELQDYRCEF